MQMLTLEEDVGDDTEHNQGDDFLNNFQLHQREWSAVIDETDTVRRHQEAVLYAGYHPRKANYGNQRPVGRDACLIEFQVSVPRKCHEDIAAN